MANSAGVEVFFVVDGPRLEAQACLLAPTLRAHLDARSQRAVAYVRSDYIDKIDPLTAEVLERSGISLREIPHTHLGHLPWSAPYPQGNKLLAAADERDCEVSVFMDTDMVLARPVNFARELGRAQIAASVSDYASPGTDAESWRSHYALFGLDLPEQRVRLRGGRRLTTLPYFNAGLVIFREADANGDPTGIARSWLEAALLLEKAGDAVADRTFIDQLALPILGYKIEAPVKKLAQRMNFNIQAFGAAPASAADIAHYHNIGVLWQHADHARNALAELHALIGPDGIERFAQTFFPHIKRKRMKQYLPEFATPLPRREAA